MKTVRLFLIGAVVCFFSCFLNCFTLGAITGPEVVKTGTLQVFESDASGDWLVYPMNKAGFAKDSDQKKLYLVANEEGEYTVLHFVVKDGKPVIEAVQFVAGEIKPGPEPTPNPQPVVKYDLTTVERTAVVKAIDYALEGIESGEVKTPQGARSAFKQKLNETGTVCNGRTCSLRPGIRKYIDEWSEKMDYSNMAALKESLVMLREEVGE